MQNSLRRALTAAALTGIAVIGAGAPAFAAPEAPAAPVPGLPSLPGVPGLGGGLPEVPGLGGGLPGVPGLDGITTILGPAAETGKLTDIAPGGVPVFGLVDSALKAPGGLGLPKLPALPGLGS